MRPMAIISLFAQSSDQHDVPSCSMRNAGSGNRTVRNVDLPQIVMDTPTKDRKAGTVA